MSFLNIAENFEEIAKKEDANAIRWRRFDKDRLALVRRLKFVDGMVLQTDFESVLCGFLPCSASIARATVHNWVEKKLIGREMKDNHQWIKL